jgi:hypothetical protein
MPFLIKVAELDFNARPAHDVWRSANLTALIDGNIAWGVLQYTYQDFSSVYGSCVRIARGGNANSEVRILLDQRYFVWTVRIYGRRDNKELAGTSAFVADSASSATHSANGNLASMVRCGVGGSDGSEATLSVYNTTTTVADGYVDFQCAFGALGDTLVIQSTAGIATLCEIEFFGHGRVTRKPSHLFDRARASPHTDPVDLCERRDVLSPYAGTPTSGHGSLTADEHNLHQCLLKANYTGVAFLSSRAKVGKFANIGFTRPQLAGVASDRNRTEAPQFMPVG